MKSEPLLLPGIPALLVWVGALQGCSTGERLTANTNPNPAPAFRTGPAPLTLRVGKARSGNTLSDFKHYLATYGGPPEAWEALHQAQANPVDLWASASRVNLAVAPEESAAEIISPLFAIQLDPPIASAAMIYVGSFAEIVISLKISDLVSGLSFPEIRSPKLFWSGYLGQGPPLPAFAHHELRFELSRDCGIAINGAALFSAWWSLLPIGWSWNGLNIPPLKFGLAADSKTDAKKTPDCPPPPERPPSDGPTSSSGGGSWMYWIECTGFKVYVWHENHWDFEGYEDVICTSTPIWVPEYEI